jgi:isopropylmalate/homocitrate/citramalate synthase
VSDRIHLVEVCPRDGLQNEAASLPTETKLELLKRLIVAGCARIEASSFVNPKTIPQLADADELFAQISAPDGVDLIALVPNERGYDRAVAAGCKSVEVFTAATEAFCQANIRCSVTESFQRFAPIMARAAADGIRVRGAVSVAFNCPYSGPVEPAAAIEVAQRLLDIGCGEVSIADTTGTASVGQVEALLELTASVLPVDQIAMHFHDTTGLAVRHVLTSFDAGIRVFDASAGGLGGCPFSPGAPGNVATEAVLDAMDAHGIATGVDTGAIREVGTWIRAQLASAAHAPV